jgi:hypothetical protein
MAANEDYPFDFKIDKIQKELDFHVFKNNFDKALEVLEDVEYKWFKAKNENKMPSGSNFRHLEDYAMRSLLLGLEGQEQDEISEKTTDFFASWVHEKILDLKNLIDDKLNMTKDNPVEERLDVESISVLSHKITLLYELGILDLINKRFEKSRRNSNAQKARLISIILGETDKTSTESIRKLLSYIENAGHKQNPITTDSIISVEKILLEFDLKKEKI